MRNEVTSRVVCSVVKIGMWSVVVSWLHPHKHHTDITKQLKSIR